MALTPLSRYDDYEFPEGAFDVRGWTVRSELDREKVGEVHDLLLDADGRLRYLDVDMGLFSRHVLVPLEMAHTDEADDVVWLENLTKDDLKELPAYHHGKGITSEEETHLHDAYRGAWSRRVRRDVPGPEHALGARLARLSDLTDFRVAKGDVDPRGRDLVSADGQTIGKVLELIVDTAEREVRYLQCKIDEKRLHLEPVERHVLIPVEQVQIQDKPKRVLLPGLAATRVGGLPVYTGLPLSAEHEASLRDTWAPRASAPSGLSSDADQTPGPMWARRTSGARGFYAPRWRSPEQRSVEAARTSPDGDVELLPDGVEREVVKVGENQEVRVRMSGDDIIIERRPRR